jgi:RNA polymerase sigma factor (sigma-70 family)
MDLTTIQPALISACIARERRAEYDLYKITYSYMMSICIRYTKNEESAKEALNIGYMKVLSNLDKYKPEMPFKAWLRRVLINTLINEYKKEKIHYDNHQYVDDYLENDTYAELNAVIYKIDAQDIYQLIAKLPPASAQVFNMHCIDGYKHSEIATLIGISEGTSKWHLNSARQKLKELLTTANTQFNNI